MYQAHTGIRRPFHHLLGRHHSSGRHHSLGRHHSRSQIHRYNPYGSFASSAYSTPDIVSIGQASPPSGGARAANSALNHLLAKHHIKRELKKYAK